MIAYLSGPIENANNDGADWRNNITEWLVTKLNHKVFNPVIETKSIIEHQRTSDFRLMKKTNPDEYKKIIMNDKRKSSAIFGVLLIFIPFLTMDMFSMGNTNELVAEKLRMTIDISFIDILRSQAPLNVDEFKPIVYLLIVLSLISLTLNLKPKPFVTLSVIFGILALCIHVVFYSMNVMVGNEVASVSFSLGISWYLMGIGFLLLVVSPLQKKSS